MRPRFLVLSLLLVPHAGCDSSNPRFWQPKNDLLPMVALDDRIAYVEKNSHTAYLLDPADASFKPRFVTVGKAPIAAVKRNGSNQMLVVSNGDSGSAGVAPIQPQLQIIDANPNVVPAVYALAGRFDGLAQSVDGRFVVLYHTSSTQDASDTGLFNPNEMTIIDFTQSLDPKAPLPTKSIRSLGGVPARIEFSPPSVAQAGVPSLAVVLSQNYVTIMDVENTERTEISVPLCAQSAGCAYDPDTIQILFGSVDLLDPKSPFGPTNPKILNIYVRAETSKDIFQIALSIGTDAVGTIDFNASLSLLSVGANPAGMALYVSNDGPRLAVLAPTSQSLVIINPSTSQTLRIAATSIPANVIVPFTVANSDGTQRNEAMLVDTLYGSTSVLFADLGVVETSGGLEIKDSPLRAAAGDVWPLLDQGIAVLVLGKPTAISSFTAVELSTRRIVDITASSTFARPYLEARPPSRLWGVTDGTKLTYVNLVARKAGTTFAPSFVWLDQEITSIQALDPPLDANPTNPQKPRYLVVGHNDPDGIGNLTFLDADTPDRSTARTAYGFLFSNYLERGQP
jgi:hypothetical protein